MQQQQITLSLQAVDINDRSMPSKAVHTRGAFDAVQRYRNDHALSGKKKKTRHLQVGTECKSRL